ncbi:MAG: WD40 domain-containing protein [Chloroflexi bacterium OLB13]|nr:MAG: WD40 domain-containing protein [Chloroflexi bacterium OLB13]
MTPVPLLPIPGTPPPSDPLGGFRGIPSIPETDAPPLTLLSPAPQTEVYRGEIVFAWTPHPQAESYRLSVLRDGEPYFAHTYAVRHICSADLCALATYLDSGIPGFDVDVPHTWSVEPRDTYGDPMTGSRSTAAPSTFVPKRRPFVAPLPEIAPPDGMIGPRTFASKIVHLYRHGISWRYPDGSGPVYGTTEYTIASLSGCGSVAIGFCDLDYPALSPDLNRVAFVGRAALGNEQADTPDLYIASIDGTSIQRMTTTSAEETYLNWSPDGTQLAFSIWVPANNRYDLYVLSDLDTTPTVSFVIENAKYPTWSPNGTHISYVQSNCKLHALKWENGQVSDITLIALAPLNDGCYTDIDRSPTQDQYVYSSYAPTPGLRLIGVTNGIGSLPTPLADGWYTDPNWDPDGVAVAFGGQPIVGSGTTFPPSGAGLYVQRVATNGAPVGQPTTVATIAVPGPENGMRPDWNGTPVCTGARDAGGDLCQPAPTATPSPSPSPTVTPTPTLTTSIYADRYLIASGDFNPAQFDTVFVATSPSSSTATVILGSSSGFSDLRADLAALTCSPGDWDQCLNTVLAPWTLDAFGRCNTRIPHFTDTSVGAGTPTPTPMTGAGYAIAEYPGKTNHDLWQYCVVHVSVLAFIRFVDLFNGTMNSDISYDTLLQTLMWSELGAQNRNICLKGFRYSATGSIPPVTICDNTPNYPAEPVTWIWTDEVFARILFANCQNDGCSSLDFELHNYLAYFQPARDGKLDNQYESVNDGQYPLAKNLLDRSTLIVVGFPPTSWLVGRVVGRPSGFATDLSVNAQSEVWLTGRSKIYADADYLGRTNGCNLDGLALPLVYAVSDRRDIFFGTIANTSASEVCKFFDFTNATPPSTYSSRP